MFDWVGLTLQCFMHDKEKTYGRDTRKAVAIKAHPLL